MPHKVKDAPIEAGHWFSSIVPTRRYASLDRIGTAVAVALVTLKSLAFLAILANLWSPLRLQGVVPRICHFTQLAERALQSGSSASSSLHGTNGHLSVDAPKMLCPGLPRRVQESISEGLSFCTGDHAASQFIAYRWRQRLHVNPGCILIEGLLFHKKKFSLYIVGDSSTKGLSSRLLCHRFPHAVRPYAA